MKLNGESVTEEFDTVKSLVEECLAEDPRCRNSDKWLTLAIWQKKQHIKIFVPFDKIGELILPETIRRVRQKIQNEECKFLPTDPTVLVRRKIREDLIRKYFSEQSPEYKEFQRLKYQIR